MNSPTILGITCGDINGICTELVLEVFKNNKMFEYCTPILFSNLQLLNHNKYSHDLKLHAMKDLSDIKKGRLNVFNIVTKKYVYELGQPNPKNANFILSSIDHACNSLKNKNIDAVVTLPIDKNIIQSIQSDFLGHTGYFEEKFNKKSLMLMICEDLKIALLTEHIPLSKVSESICHELLNKKIDILIQTLKFDFNISKPKIAVLSLNPHAGDQGVCGNEDQNILFPFIKKRSNKGDLVFGPFPSDAFFGFKKYSHFDAVLAMYHDQALIPFKIISKNKGVNFTAGLDIVRTSPAHGPAFEIATKHNANPNSFREAIFTAIDIYKNRKSKKIS